MSKQIRFFGGTTQGQVLMDDGQQHVLPINRDIWFDQDIDGRWLVGVTVRDAGDSAFGEEATTGAIVVKDPTLGAFIEMLGRLVAEPEMFAHEPVVIDASLDFSRQNMPV